MKDNVRNAVRCAWGAALLFLLCPSSHVAAPSLAAVPSGEPVRKNRPKASLWNHPQRVAAWGADNRARWANLDHHALRREDAAFEGVPGLPLRLGVNRPAPGGAIGLKKGRKARHASGRFLWTYQINDPGAHALRVHFSRLELPADAELAVAGQNGEAEIYRGGQEPLWTPLIAGETAYLEYRSPVGDARPPEIEVDQISHIYVDALAANSGTGMETMPCQVDVNCVSVPPAVRDAVGHLVFTGQSGTYSCTGTLLADADPNTSAGYLLTANHCVSTEGVAASVTVYWFYQSDTCNGTVPALTSLPRSHGSTLLATASNNVGTDFTLLRLRDDPPDGQGFVEWTTDQPVGPLASIHHPRREHKRISLGELTSSPPICGSYPTNRFLYLDWVTGVTEPGSSGGPLFDSNWRLVGQLYGTCSTRNPTCTNSQDYNVLFGRFSGAYPLIASNLQSVTPDDAYEDNDTLEQAWPIAMGTNALRLVDFADYFSVTLPRAARINLTATFSTAALDLDLALLRADGNVLFSSAGATGTETINSPELPAGNYVIQATKSHRWGGDYTLAVTLVPNSNAAPVAITDRLEHILTNGVKFLAVNLLVNDPDADGDAIRLLSIDTTSANGATVTRNGAWVHYTPAAGFTSSDSFTYRIADFFNATATGTVLVTNNITPVPSPNLSISEAGNGSFVLGFDGVPGKTYGIEYSDALDPPDWHRLGTSAADAFGHLEFMDSPPNGLPRRFYRTVYPP